jgi:hypothetical protein
MLATLPTLASFHDVKITDCDASTATAPTTHHQRILAASRNESDDNEGAGSQPGGAQGGTDGPFRTLTFAQPNPLTAPKR